MRGTTGILSFPTRRSSDLAQRDGQDEDVDEQQIEREQPSSPRQVVLADVFNHRDLELARQQHDRQHGNEDEGPPITVTGAGVRDRKSTRLNSSHLGISYAV